MYSRSGCFLSCRFATNKPSRCLPFEIDFVLAGDAFCLRVSRFRRKDSHNFKNYHRRLNVLDALFS
jgi:hypothetical protein